MRRQDTQPARGFTLVEALLASVVLAMAITAVTMPFTAGARNELENARRTLAVALAQEMMEEILSKPFADDVQDFARSPGPDAGEGSRTFFDNMDDYDGYEELPGSIASHDGQLFTDAAADGLSRHVSAGYVYVSGQDVSDAPSFLRVVVDVRYRGEPVVTLSRLAYALGQ